MIIAGRYSFKHGEEHIRTHYPKLLAEVEAVISSVDANDHRTKQSKEKTVVGRYLFSPASLNVAFKQAFHQRGWYRLRVPCVYPTHLYTPNYVPREPQRGAFREIDFIKETLGLEVQFGKSVLMVYSTCAKMTIFHKLGHIQAGIEIVPIQQLADQMSTGVSYFEQFVWDLEQRGAADIDIPVIVLGVGADPAALADDDDIPEAGTAFLRTADPALVAEAQAEAEQQGSSFD